MAKAKPTQEEAPLASQHCSQDAKRLPVLPPARRRDLHVQVPDWRLSPKSLSRTWRLKDFAEALDLANRIGKVAERERHHPDLHLEGYRNLRAVLSTHAAGGLTMNDFILAAHIDVVAPSPDAGRRVRRGRRPAQDERTGERKRRPRLLRFLGS